LIGASMAAMVGLTRMPKGRNGESTIVQASIHANATIVHICLCNAFDGLSHRLIFHLSPCNQDVRALQKL